MYNYIALSVVGLNGVTGNLVLGGSGMAASMLQRGVDYEGGTSRDEAGGQIPSSSREMYEMICVTEGGAEYWVEDQYYKLKTGDILFVPAGVMVSATAFG